MWCGERIAGLLSGQVEAARPAVLGKHAIPKLQKPCIAILGMLPSEAGAFRWKQVEDQVLFGLTKPCMGQLEEGAGVGRV